MQLNEFVFELICIGLITISVIAILIIHILKSLKNDFKKETKVPHLISINHDTIIDIRSIKKIQIKCENKEDICIKISYYESGDEEIIHINDLIKISHSYIVSESEYVKAYNLFGQIVSWIAGDFTFKNNKYYDVGILHDYSTK